MIPLVLSLVAATASPPDSQPAPESPRAPISGRVLDAEGEPVPGASIFVLDAATGIPVRGATWGPFPDGAADIESAASDIVVARTDDGGRFGLPGARPGSYRLLAQSWSGGEPKGDDPATLLDLNGTVLTLHGSTSVSLTRDGDADPVEIRPVGASTLLLADHAPNDSSLFMVSAAAPRTDPGVGFLGWVGPHLRGVLAAGRLPGDGLEIRGLPEAEVFVTIFSPDNVPGFGGTPVAVQAAIPTWVRIPWVSGWSDAVHRPPARLEPLVARFGALPPAERRRIQAAIFEGFRAGMTMADFTTAVETAMSRTIPLPDGEAATVPDLIAAITYRALIDSAESIGRTPNPHRPAEIRPATIADRLAISPRAAEHR